MNTLNIAPHIDGITVPRVADNHAPPTEAAPTPHGPVPYPDWPAVVDSLIEVLGRLHAADWPPQGVSGPIAPADGRPPDPAPPTDGEAFQVCVAGCDLPAGPRANRSLNGLLEEAMALHLRALLRHNRQERMDSLTQGSEGGHD